MNGIIIYKGKYGATRQYADWLSEELQIPAMQPGQWGDKELQACEYIILASSVYIGNLQIKKWLKRNSGKLTGKKIFLLIVCATPASETKKVAAYASSSVPAKILKDCRVYYALGRLEQKKLSIRDRFLLYVGALLSKDPKVKEAMHTDYDGVKKEFLQPLINDVMQMKQDA